MKRAILRASDLTREDVERIFALATVLKDERRRGIGRDTLRRRHVALYFEKPSVRTRVSFTVGIRELGGDVVELAGNETKVGRGEDPFDFAAVIGRYCDALVARVFSDESLDAMARGIAPKPVVNALSDRHHPCQALADFFTLRERLGDRPPVVAFLGDGTTNVLASLAELGAILGATVIAACPESFAPNVPGVAVVRDPRDAVRAADALYTDTFVSMGFEDDAARRRRELAPYRLTRSLLDLASAHAVVMHCLPAVRDEEIDGDLLHDARSAVLEQAENRLHVQKALLSVLLSP